jgi:hypothetical protein
MIARDIASLWRGETPLRRVFWEHAIAWGTLINLVCTGAALVAFVNGAPAWLGLLLHFAPVPYNALLVVSIWRAAAKEDETPLANFARGGILIWFFLMLVL